jgi:hypothetical protein
MRSKDSVDTSSWLEEGELNEKSCWDWYSLPGRDTESQDGTLSKVVSAAEYRKTFAKENALAPKLIATLEGNFPYYQNVRGDGFCGVYCILTAIFTKCLGNQELRDKILANLRQLGVKIEEMPENAEELIQLMNKRGVEIAQQICSSESVKEALRARSFMDKDAERFTKTETEFNPRAKGGASFVIESTQLAIIFGIICNETDLKLLISAPTQTEFLNSGEAQLDIQKKNDNASIAIQSPSQDLIHLITPENSHYSILHSENDVKLLKGERVPISPLAPAAKTTAAAEKELAEEKEAHIEAAAEAAKAVKVRELEAEEVIIATTEEVAVALELTEVVEGEAAAALRVLEAARRAAAKVPPPPPVPPPPVHIAARRAAAVKIQALVRGKAAKAALAEAKAATKEAVNGYVKEQLKVGQVAWMPQGQETSNKGTFVGFLTSQDFSKLQFSLQENPSPENDDIVVLFGGNGKHFIHPHLDDNGGGQAAAVGDHTNPKKQNGHFAFPITTNAMGLSLGEDKEILERLIYAELEVVKMAIREGAKVVIPATNDDKTASFPGERSDSYFFNSNINNRTEAGERVVKEIAALSDVKVSEAADGVEALNKLRKFVELRAKFFQEKMKESGSASASSESINSFIKMVKDLVEQEGERATLDSLNQALNKNLKQTVVGGSSVAAAEAGAGAGAGAEAEEVGVGAEVETPPAPPPGGGAKAAEVVAAVSGAAEEEVVVVAKAAEVGVRAAALAAAEALAEAEEAAAEEKKKWKFEEAEKEITLPSDSGTPNTTVKVMLAEPVVSNQQSIWIDSDRGNKFRVLAGVYDENGANHLQLNIERTFLKILTEVAKDTKDQLKLPNDLSVKQILAIIKAAKERGGVANKFNKDTKKYLSDDELKKAENRLEVKDGDVEFGANVAKYFSALFQKECQECGIYTGRETSSTKMVGLRLTFIPDDVVEHIKNNGITDQGKSLKEIKDKVADKTESKDRTI